MKAIRKNCPSEMQEIFNFKFFFLVIENSIKITQDNFKRKKLLCNEFTLGPPAQATLAAMV
jgi:hypothetical protein